MINFFAPINNLGYGIHAYNFMKALDKFGINIALFPVNDSVNFTNENISKWLENRNKFNKNDVSVMIYHEFAMARFCGGTRIAFPVFETGISEVSKNVLKSVDYILQPSEYGKGYLNKLGFNNVYVVPEGHDEQIFNMNDFDIGKKKQLIQEKSNLIFSHIGKLEERKSSLDILRVFTQSLDGCGLSCTLVVQMFNPFMPTWLEIIHSELVKLGFSLTLNARESVSYGRNNIRIIVLRGTVKDITSIYKQSHFGIYASKAEGWNLPLIESLACGVPCITSNWSGESEYLKKYPKEFILDKGETVVADDRVWFFGDRGNWVRPDLSSLKSILRNIASDPVRYLDMVYDCYDSIKNFTWDNSAKRFVEVLKELNLYKEE